MYKSKAYQSHLRVNGNIFRDGMAVIGLSFIKQVSVFWSLTRPITINRITGNVLSCGQWFKKSQPVPPLLAKSSYSAQVINKRRVNAFQQEQNRSLKILTPHIYVAKKLKTHGSEC